MSGPTPEKKSKLQNAVCSQGAKTIPLYFCKNNSTRKGSERLPLIPSLEPRTVYWSSYSHVIVWIVRLDLHSIFPVNTNLVMVLHYYACVQCVCEMRRRIEMERYNERETESSRCNYTSGSVTDSPRTPSNKKTIQQHLSFFLLLKLSLLNSHTLALLSPLTNTQTQTNKHTNTTRGGSQIEQNKLLLWLNSYDPDA